LALEEPEDMYKLIAASSIPATKVILATQDTLLRRLAIDYDRPGADEPHRVLR
jgi:hypothetical protein